MNLTDQKRGKRSKQPWKRCLHKVRDGCGNACSYRSSLQDLPQTTSPCLQSSNPTKIYGQFWRVGENSGCGSLRKNQQKTLRLIDYELININIKEDDAIAREEMENKHWNKEKNMLYRGRKERKESEIRWILLPSPFC